MDHEARYWRLTAQQNEVLLKFLRGNFLPTFKLNFQLVQTGDVIAVYELTTMGIFLTPIVMQLRERNIDVKVTAKVGQRWPRVGSRRAVDVTDILGGDLTHNIDLSRCASDISIS